MVTLPAFAMLATRQFLPDPAIEFVLFAGSALVLAFMRWRSGRIVATAAVVVAAFAVAGVFGCSSESARVAWVNVYRLFGLPLLSVAALVVGIAGLLRPPRKARFAAVALTVLGGGFFGSLVLEEAADRRYYRIEYQRLRLAAKLYWDESIRCRDNLAVRFGPFEQRQKPCRGNMMVVSGGDPSNPISRVLVNDSGLIRLLSRSEDGIEEEWPSAGAWFLSGVTAYWRGTARMTLREELPASCDATLEWSGGATSVLRLAKAPDLPSCTVTENPPVKLVGAWSTVEDAVDLSGVAGNLAFTQVLLWESGGRGYGLLFRSGPVLPGRTTEMAGLRFWAAVGADRHSWVGYLDDSVFENRKALTLTVTNGQAHVYLFDSGKNLDLSPTAPLLPPKVALAPVRDSKLFTSYFDAVLAQGGRVNWTAPGPDPQD